MAHRCKGSDCPYAGCFVRQKLEVSPALRARMGAKLAAEPCPGCLGEESFGGWLDIPPPPPLALPPPTAPRAVVTCAVGPEGRAMFAASRGHLTRYAEWVGADLVVLADYAGNTAYGPSCKFGMGRVLDYYDRIAFIDADALCRPGCLNVFDLCGEDEVGFVDEWGRIGRAGQDRHRRFRADMGFRTAARVGWYLNSGVLVWPKRYQHLLAPPDRIPGKAGGAHWTAEQEWWSAVLLDAGAKVRLMDARANWQNWFDAGFRDQTPECILHWSGQGQPRRERVADIKRWAARYPWPEFWPGEPPHGWAVERVHCLWLYETLKRLRPRRALEIGSHFGYSSQAFLAAQRAGHVGEVHLCEPNVTPQLEMALARFPGVNVTVHRERSIDLLRRDAAFDFVFVDGDHSAATGEEEARLLLAARVPAVMVHDTYDGRPGVEGANHLKRAFLAAGYAGQEDPGPERRGMFFAERSSP